MGHSILEFSDRDILKYYKNFKDIKGSKTLNDKLKKTCYNYKPDLIILGHADSIFSETLSDLKDDYPYLKVAQWFLDPLNKKGPDYERNKVRKQFVPFVETSSGLKQSLRAEIGRIAPDILMEQTIELGGETVNVDIPLAVEFFWPNGKP